MQSARRSLFRNLIFGFALLIFSLLLILSGVWTFFFSKILTNLNVGVADAQQLLVGVGLFVLIVAVVLTIIGGVIGFILIYPVSGGLWQIWEQIAGYKAIGAGTRVEYNNNDELGDLTGEINNVITGLEQGAILAEKEKAAEEKKFQDEQILLTAEQKRIFEEKQKLEYVLSNIGEGVILMDHKRNVAALNKGAEDLTGFKQVEAMGRNIFNIVRFYNKDNEEIGVDEYAGQNNGSPKVDEAYVKKGARLESTQATSKIVDITCVRLNLIRNQDLGFLLVLHDLTARLEVEKRRTEMIASFARELAPTVRLIENISDSANLQSGVANLSLMLDNLLAAGEIDNGSMALEQSEVDLSEVVAEVVENVKALATSRQLVITVQEHDSATKVLGDKKRIYQILMNLILNALYFTLPGGNVTISFSQSEKEIISQIQDTGIGIKSEELAAVFDKFFVAENSRGVSTGLGLGLYVCRKMTERMNGKIWIDSVEGRGSVASVSLPKAS